MNDIIIKKENSPYIFSFPHSGQMLSSEMEWKLYSKDLKFLPNIDWYLNELYDFLQSYKVNIISTPHSRYVVDVNRPLDAKRLGNYRDSLVYNTNTWDEDIYAIPPNEEEMERRVTRYYKPYHEELQALIEEKAREFGKVYLIDMHSFMGPISADVCLGNRHNVTSSKEFIDKFYDAFSSEGFSTVKNEVFIGGYITKSYAIKDVVETLQIELRYSNYIEEHDLDIRQKPNMSTTLFAQTALRLEEVMKKVGIEKKEHDKVLSTVEESKVWYRRMWMAIFVMGVIFAMQEDLKVVFGKFFG